MTSRTTREPILNSTPYGRFPKTALVTAGLFNLGARASAWLRVLTILEIVVFLLIAGCRTIRTPSKRYPDASVKSSAEDANRLRESNTISVDDANDSEDATRSKDVDDDDVTVISNDSGSVDARPDGPYEEAVLAGPPLIFATTDTEFSLNLVLLQGDMHQLQLQLREPIQTQWSAVSGPTIGGDDVAQWRVRWLSPSTEYEYRILDRVTNDEKEPLYRGRIRTRRQKEESFTFCILSDSHVYVDDPSINGYELTEVANNIQAEEPDFVVHLGDILDFHYFGFNRPPPENSWTKIGYLSYRDLMGELLGGTTHFAVIGNWDGENGDFTAEEIERSRSQRLLYLPGPEPSTYPQGGSVYQDYYAFTWGDALFIVLNVMSYTPSGHYLSDDIGLSDDWTLGEEQLLWLEETLKNSGSKWRVIFIHHPVGGNGGDEANSAYGRGGGRAASVGEQATVHALMRDYGVQVFFYGHDHVFFDMVVDGIHYTIPGSAGAPWKFSSAETGYPKESYWTDSGYAKVDVAPNRMDVAFINIDSETIYQYTIQ